MAQLCKYGSENCIGSFVKLTNTYCMVPVEASAEFISYFQLSLKGAIPLFPCSIASTALIGVMSTANKHGLILPNNTTDQEMQNIKNSLPENVKVQRVEDRLSALGNIVSCNDSVAIVHPDLERDTQEIIADVLNVEVYPHLVANISLVGTYSVFNNKGGLVHPRCSIEEQDELSKLLQIPLMAGTVNGGSEMVGKGLVLNDWITFAGYRTTPTELSIITEFLQQTMYVPDELLSSLSRPIVESLM